MGDTLTVGRHVAALRGILSERAVQEGEAADAPYLRDWTGDYVSVPLCVVLPSSTSEVSQVLAYCSAHGLVVVPQGGNTGLVGGSHAASSERDVIVNLRRMNEIRNFDAVNYTMEVEAGCIIQTLQEAAASQDRLFPLSFGAQGSAQIGGAIATNAGGLNVLRYGMLRDMVLGVEAVLPDGRVFNGLSRLRKDNRGLDLKQLFIGSEGALGIVTAATLKLFPRPTHKETVWLALKDLESVTALYNLARASCADLLSAFELIPRRCVEMGLEHQPSLRDPLSEPYDNYVLMDLSASGPVDLRSLVDSFLESALLKGLILDGALAASLTQANAMWAIREAMVEAQVARGRHLRTDISVPVSDVPAFISLAQASLSEIAEGWIPIAYGHVGDGNVHLNVLPPKTLSDSEIQELIPGIHEEIYAVLDRFGGSISAEHGIGRTRRREYRERQDATALWLGEAVKHLVDSGNSMNAGCLFGFREEKC